MKNVAQRLIGPVLVFLMLGSAAGCQGSVSQKADAKEKKTQGPIVRVHGTKPIGLGLAMVVFFESSSEDANCTELRMTGRRVPVTARHGVWPESLPLNFPNLKEQDVNRVPLHTSRHRSECGVRVGEKRECYEFSGSIAWKGGAGCLFRQTSLSVPIFKDREYVGGVAFSLSEREERRLEAYEGEVNIECVRGGRSGESTTTDVQCSLPDDAFRGYRIDSVNVSKINLNINIYYNN